jgi:hypothetical protein
VSDADALGLTVTFTTGSATVITLSQPIADEKVDPMRRMIARWRQEWHRLEHGLAEQQANQPPPIPGQ